MSSSPLALAFPFPPEPPVLSVAKVLLAHLAQGSPVTRGTINSALNDHFGGSDADGRWSVRDAHAALELAQVLWLVEAGVDAARQAGTLDLGVETIAVETFDILSDTQLQTDAVSGATTHLLELEIARALKPFSFERLKAQYGLEDIPALQPQTSGQARWSRNTAYETPLTRGGEGPLLRVLV